MEAKIFLWPPDWMVLLIHQLLFQGMFFAKNLVLRMRLGKPIRGRNIEAILSVLFFALFIGLSFVLAYLDSDIGRQRLLSETQARLLGLGLLFGNLLISALSLLHLRDSWRVGVLEDQKTELVTDGIYAYSRNPYFFSYLLLFFGYTVLLQNWILFVLALVGFGFIHKMILKEESYLLSVHGQSYKDYTKRTHRYFLVF